MIFSSYTFIFLFFPIVFAVYAVLRKAGKINAMKIWLVLASLFFYGFGDPRFFPVLFFTAIFNFFISRGLQKDGVKQWQRVLLMVIGVAENLGLLFYFKYSNFFLENFNRLTGADIPLLHIILPLGISFYTFQLISYLADSFSGDAKGYSFIDYMVFVTFFPQLIVGPVVTHDDIMPQLSEKNLLRVDKKGIMLGILLFAIGCFKKIVIADPLITHAAAYYNGGDVSGIFRAWSAVLAYTFAYYFDFSGYIDMALGLGRFFNIELPQNFNSPYKARNFADFWRRWNITVSNFLNDNVFKNIFHFGDGVVKLIIATLITFIVSGLWHGAGWHFVAWGVANGIFVCFANIMTLHRKSLPFPLAWALTFFFSVLVRVLFDALNTAQAFEVYKVMFTPVPWDELAAQWTAYISGSWGIIGMLIFSAVIIFGFRNSGEIAERFEPKARYAVYSAVLLGVSLFFMGQVSNFLYFQF